MPAPPFFHSPGDIASWVTNRSCSRPGPESPESSAAVEHAGGIAQQAFGVIQRQRLHEGFWRETSPPPEQMVQFVGRHAAASAIDSMVGLARRPVFRNESDGAPHRVVVAQRGGLGPAW